MVHVVIINNNETVVRLPVRPDVYSWILVIMPV